MSAPVANGASMEAGWNDGDIDDLLDRMLQQNAQEHSSLHRPDAAGELLPNIWSPGADVDVKIEVSMARLNAALAQCKAALWCAGPACSP